MPTRKLIILREDKPSLNKKIGDVIDVLPGDKFEGKEVAVVGKVFVRVVVSDLSKLLEGELMSGIKCLRSPDIQDPFYQELLTKGFISVNEETLLNYVELK